MDEQKIKTQFEKLKRVERTQKKRVNTTWLWGRMAAAAAQKNVPRLYFDSRNYIRSSILYYQV